MQFHQRRVMLADYTWDKLLILPQYTGLERNWQVGVICITNYSGQTFSAVRGEVKQFD